MRKIMLIIIGLVIIVCGCRENPGSSDHTVYVHPELKAGNPGALLVVEAIDSMGGLKAYGALQDVEFKYIYRDADSLQDVSIERYKYKGELSWAKYTEHTKSIMPDKPGVVIQGFDGQSVWSTYNGEIQTDQQSLGIADFMRKTNFYWFNMMFKLLDPGTRFELKTDREVNGVNYKIVEVSFEEGVGDAQDIYLLYVNEDTKLVDQFLFTVMDFNRSEPLLMQVKYEEINGLKWPVKRRYAPSTWKGELQSYPGWTEEISENIKFNNGFSDELFARPD